LRDGVTTLEIKSGYGLDLASECKMLRVARRIGTELGMTVRTTFLGAHCVPPEFQQRKTEYLDLLCDGMLPAVANQGLADAVDAYCETIAFTAQEIRRLFHAATRLGLRVKLHADQLSDSSGAALAAECNALSADHLEYTNPQGIQALAASGTVAVLLPGAFYALRETRAPPIAQMRAAGVAMAIATDLNPGTSPLLSLRQALNQACILFRLTPLEALHGATTQAAKALGLTDRGTLAIGQRADVAVWDVESPAELMYWMGGSLARRVFINGCEV
jgi:imidazolonepropionase